MKRFIGLLALCWPMCGAGCQNPSPAGPGDANGTATDARARADVGTDGCVPRACPASACGSVSNGCGGEITCTDGCECDPHAVTTSCPERPCETATSCSATGACVYEPVSCNFERCACPAGMTCLDTDVRQCGATCGGQVCDPTPTVVGATTHYANMCRDYLGGTCGVCDLGEAVCEGASIACAQPEIPGVFAASANCEGGSVTASAIYLDVLYTGSDSDGSRARPFVTLQQAYTAASLRSARAIIIGGSPTLVGPLDVMPSVSLVGGYTGRPDWLPSSARPVFQSTEDEPDAPARRVALRATDVTRPTLLHHLAFVTTDSDGTSVTNAGAYISGSPALVLHDVTFTVGAGGPGEAGGAGANGPVGAPGAPGMDGSTLAPACMNRMTTADLTRSGGPPGASCGFGGAGGSMRLTISGTAPNYPSTFAPSPGMSSSASGTTGRGGAVSPFLDSRHGGAGANGVGAAADGADGRASLSGVGFPTLGGHGAAGTTGAAGQGGGGGAAGDFAHACSTNCAATWETTSPCGYWILNLGYPGTGGGGGGGGCGGVGGSGGEPGGWSVGLVVSNSNGIALEQVVVSLSEGGEGAPGGAGGTGGEGGAGGTPAFNLPNLRGGSGGAGGRGQTGGTGGRGADGGRASVYCDELLPTGALDGVSAGTDTAIGCAPTAP